MRIYSKLACFIGGVLFGSVGIKLLSSKDAKKAYTHITAAGLRMKDSAMKTVATVQENAGDILAPPRILMKSGLQKKRRKKPRLRSLTKTMRKTKSRKNESSAAKGAVTAAPFFMEVFQ